MAVHAGEGSWSVGEPWLGATVAVALLAQIVVVNSWPSFPSPNERARVYQALAVVNRGSLAIDDELARLGEMEDVAVRDDHRYPNKGPGLLPLLLPGAMLARAVAPADPQRELAVALVLGRMLASGAPFLIMLFLLARLCRDRLPTEGSVAITVYALASPALAGSLLLFSHTLSACLLLVAFLLLHHGPPPRVRDAALAGALLGWAAIGEYPMAVPGAVLAFAALSRVHLRGAVALVLGGAVPLGALAAYNAVCFGSPLALSSAHEASRAYATLAGQGVFGVSWPSLAALAGELVSPARGVLVWVPLAVAAPLGVLEALRARPRLRESLVAAATWLALWLVMAGYPNWHGGWFGGPRYLLATLPFLIILVAWGERRLLARRAGRVAVAVAAAWGWWMTWPVLATFPFPPEDFRVPAVTLALPLLRSGTHVPSWLPASLVWAVLALLAAAALAIPLSVATRMSKPSERLIVAVIAVTAIAASLLVPPPQNWKGRLEGAVIRDIYAGSGDRRALDALRRECGNAAECASVGAWIARRDNAHVAR